MARKLTVEEREAFLAEPRVGIISSTAEPGRAPLTVPIWYDYRPGGDLTVLTSPHLRKARLIAEAGRFSLCVQHDGAPYRYVTVEGPVVATAPITEGQRRALAIRYLGTEYADGYLTATHASQAGNIAITMRPDRWTTSSFDDLTGRLTG